MHFRSGPQLDPVTEGTLQSQISSQRNRRVAGVSKQKGDR